MTHLCLVVSKHLVKLSYGIFTHHTGHIFLLWHCLRFSGTEMDHLTHLGEQGQVMLKNDSLKIFHNFVKFIYQSETHQAATLIKD